MRQFPLEGLDIAPGRVVEWRLRARGVADGSRTEESGRRASFNQDKHFSVVEEARKANDPFASWLALTFEVGGTLDRGALESAFLFFARRHEVLRCEFRRLAGDLACAALEPEDIALEALEIGEFDSTKELRAFMADSFTKSIDTLAWPLFMMGAVVREESSTVYLAFDHIVSDGMSMSNVVYDIQNAYAAFARGEEAALPEAGSYLDFAHEQSRRYGSIGADDTRLDYWKSFIASNGEFFPRFPLELGVESGRMYPTVNEADRLLDARETEELEARCLAAGGKVFMGVLAAVAVSLRQAGGPGVYRGFMPVSERGRGPWKHSVGWFVNTMPIEFSVAEDKDFEEIMAGVRSGFTEMMRHIDVPFVRAWELLAPHHFALRSWPFPVNFFSYIDMRKCPGSENFEEWRPASHVWSSRANGTCSWYQRNFRGLFMNSIFVDTPEARRTMGEFQGALRETLLELSRSGALTKNTGTVG
ncbi:condensation domain-containing protein [Streptomyces sp. ISL-11]|uniref:condensation domain-containing protein n=1 Tax=Streptomyces sp. ISL-11 TaxID=2819174 RepID=UPI001BE941FA|nr:condensation domain-containing protein [Streptomyces sp. ISL-11]MBT2382444.1 hypothetical protein [Streptomyces sp. ISL-11]